MMSDDIEIKLTTPLARIFRLAPTVRAGLTRLGITTVHDLIHYLPQRYNDPAQATTLSATTDGDTVTLYGIITKIDLKKSWRGKIPMAFGVFEDTTDKAEIVWFNQPYIAKTIPAGSAVCIAGTIQKKKNKISLANPEIEIIENIPDAVGEGLFSKESLSKLPTTILPIYPETRGLTSRWIRHALKRVMTESVLSECIDPIPESVRNTLHLPHIKTALVWIHTPGKIADAEVARKRFAFQEIFAIQTQRQIERHRATETRAWDIDVNKADTESFIARFGFELTKGQRRVIETILEDLKKTHPMSRLVEGDVGSGKTAIASVAAYATVTSAPKSNKFARLQVAYMCPTEILARQQFENMCQYFKHGRVQVGLLTSSGCMKFPSKAFPGKPTDVSRAQLSKWLLSGDIHIVVGTHSLIQNSVQFKHLGLVIIDEQHRFGTQQRMKLAKKHDHIPHLLSMTATPIPRTLALTIYGDLDLSVLDETPPGRKPIITKTIAPHERDAMYEVVEKELASGRQAFVLCPRIDEPDTDKAASLEMRSVKSETVRLQKIFKKYKVAMLHGKMTPKNKEEIMAEFSRGDIHILVSTSVIEVGVNVPNATVVIIEGAERFGLAQLHQIRGRVMRSSHQPYCYVCSETENARSIERLRALVKAKTGFELAEYDLNLRGTGDLYGMKQWGVSDLGMEALRNIKLVEAARTEATKIINSDPELSQHPILKAHIEKHNKEMHLE